MSWLRHPVRGVMLDITGVLYESGKEAIQGSVEATEGLRAAGLAVVLVSNESTQPTGQLVHKLQRLGFSWVTEEDVITPVPAAREIIRQGGLNPHLLVHQDVVSEFNSVMKADEPKTCVVMGDADSNFSFENMNAAFNCLLAMKEPKLYCLGRGRYYRHNDQLQLDVGAFTAALEFATGTVASVIGKPSQLYYQKALDHLKMAASEVVMVGDDLHGDVIGSREAVGCRAVLVRTGKFQTAWAGHEAPSFVADNLANCVHEILQAKLTWT